VNEGEGSVELTAGLHNGLGLLAELRAIADLRAQEVARHHGAYVRVACEVRERHG
jgi:hypothetical protein